jgi:hypothetical protein
MKIIFKPNEVVIKASDSEHILGQVVNKGKLILTNQRVYFVQQLEETTENIFEVLPSEIIDVMNFKTGWLSKNGLSITKKDGILLKFRLKNSQQWIESIAGMC